MQAHTPTSVIVHASSGYQQEKGRNQFETFSPTCFDPPIRHVLVLMSFPGYHFLDLDTTSNGEK